MSSTTTIIASCRAAVSSLRSSAPHRISTAGPSTFPTSVIHSSIRATTTTQSSFTSRRTILTAARSPSTLFVSSATALRSSNQSVLATHRSFSSTSAAMGVHNLNAKADFDKAIAEKDSLVVLDCFATWCGPCKVIAPQVVKFSDEFPNARFYKLDVDEVPDVAQELAIRAMPTFLLFKNGEKVGEVVGANPKALQAAIQSNI